MPIRDSKPLCETTGASVSTEELDTGDLRAVLRPGERVIVVDGERWRDTAAFRGIDTLPFLERDGAYDGAPADSRVAIDEIERLRAAGATAIVFLWTEFWWFDYYSEFHRLLSTRYRCRFESDGMVVFDLRADSGAKPRFETYPGYGRLYGRCRPAPPEVLRSILPALAATPRPACVVDLGCGTGLSTRFWAGCADRVVGVDADAEMLATAREESPEATIEFHHAPADDSGLAADSADIVTCSQALHWMDPARIFPEVARILRPGGVFAAYDCDWPPMTSSLAVVESYRRFERRALALHRKQNRPGPLSKQGHLARMRASACFRYTAEMICHGSERGDAERFIAMARSQAFVTDLLELGVDEEALGLGELRREVERLLPGGDGPFVFGYRIRLGVV